MSQCVRIALIRVGYSLWEEIQYFTIQTRKPVLGRPGDGSQSVKL